MGQERGGGYPETLLTRAVINAAIEVHKVLGPGLLESAYSACLVKELSEKNLSCVKEGALPVEYKGLKLDCGYRLDIVVENKLVLELKMCRENSPDSPVTASYLSKAFRQESGINP